LAHEGFVERFRETFLAQDSDIDGFVELLDKNIEWTIVATGETFRGIESFRKFAESSRAARTHTKETQMEEKSLFTTSDYFVVEYLHNAIITANWTSSSSTKPAPGAIRHIPICIVGHFKGEKLDWAHEYFDLQTITTGASAKLYS